jgi:hypothetical protein
LNKGGIARKQIIPKWLGLSHKKRQPFSYEIRKYHNPWSEPTCLARSLDLALHITYTINSNFIIFVPSKRLNGSVVRRTVYKLLDRPYNYYSG